MTSNTANGISFDGYSNIYDVEESHAVCIIMDSQNPKASVPIQKSNSTQKYTTDTKTSYRALLPKNQLINVGLLIIILFVIIATVLVLEVGLKFNILSMSPKTNVPLLETELNDFPQDRVMLTHSTALVNSTTLQTIPIGHLEHITKSCFQCKNGNCVSFEVFCDTKDDCGDNTDEYACDCGEPGTEFSCNSGSSYLCVNQAWVCDGMEDCPGGDDEIGCDV